MLVSTKLGTVVQFFSRGESSTTEGLPTAQASYRSLTCFRVATLAVDQTGELASQERGDGEAAFRGQHARLAERLFVEGQCDVASSGHREHV
ncbi:MAG TPA: hypothetical protein VF331_12760 [Polyangiales bacterium]